jgi:hypothetical protein
MKSENKFKYGEDKVLDKVKNYIESTYEQHYIGKDGLQIQDVFDMIDISEDFCRGAAIKYLIRYGQKDGKNPKDLMKCIHYITLMYHYSKFDKE